MMKRMLLLLLAAALAVCLWGCNPGSGYGKYSEIYQMLEQGDYAGAHAAIDALVGTLPTTAAPTTEPSTTAPLTTATPTTAAPTTVPPTTEPPTTVPPTTVPPTTVPPTTVPSTTESPTTEPLTTEIPTTATPTTAAPIVPGTDPAPVPTQSAGEEGSGIRVIEYPATVCRNETATVTIQGKPNTQYSIEVHYKSGVSTAAGLESKVSDGDGMVSWSWKIGGRTSLGTFRIVVSGGGETESMEFTVLT